MKAIQKIIHAGFAICAMASASMPALSWTAWPIIDFEWHGDDHPLYVARYTEPAAPQLAAGPQAGDPIPRSPDAYPIDSSRR